MSHDVTPQRYRLKYRADEVDLVMRYASRGESLCFVGTAGVGKSNFINFLRDIRRNAELVSQSVEDMHFPIVDTTYWEGTPVSLWQMMLDALVQATEDLPPSPDSDKVSILEEARVINTLRAQLRWMCQELKQEVMFVLDDFDAVFETGPLAMLERLNALRSEGNRGHLSYLIFTKRLPHLLGERHDIENRSKFYDLFRHNIYVLEPYTPEDARQMLVHLNEVADRPLSTRDLAQIHALAGGHARLLKVVFDTWLKEPPSAASMVAHFASSPDVQQECQRILLNLHEQEQQVAVLVARGGQTSDYRDVINHLVLRGLLLESGAWFSPLFAQFLSTYET